MGERFESYVISFGSKAMGASGSARNAFESYVISFGSKANCIEA